MVKFLVERPIAVIMTVLAVSVLGIIAFLTMPVSLLPEIEIPEIRVRVNYPNIDARNLENTVVKPLRRQLMQVGGLKEIESETGDGFSEIVLSFSYTTKIEYAYIEVNEKVDAITGHFPREMERPQVIKAKPSDIPVFYISIVPSAAFYNKGKKFQDLSDYAEAIVKRRLEQISEVSMVDISGLEYPQIVIKPYQNKMKNLGFADDDIAEAIKRNNIQFGNLSFRDGHYVYRLRFRPAVKTVEDFYNIILSKDGRLFKLSEIAEIKLESNPGGGLFFHNGSRAVSMAVYKQADARMQDVSDNVDKAINNLRSNEPDIGFFPERDQTELLNYSISNLKQTLLLGIILAMFIIFLLIGQPKLPIIISISIPVSLIISFFFLHISGISINIISLSGLILSVGLMIDNSIIVIDNINQYRTAGQSTFAAAITGTNEVTRPLISSVLTTIAVFVPLISLSGIAGAIFFDQAITISISLFVSLFVSIMVIPVLYNIVIKDSASSIKTKQSHWMLSIYEKSLLFVMKRKVFFAFIFFLLIPLGFLLFSIVKKEKFPELKQTDLMASIEWNEAVSLAENKTRTLAIVDKMSHHKLSSSAYVGKISFALSEKEGQSFNSALLYLDFDSVINMDDLSFNIRMLLGKEYPLANIRFSPSENMFRTIFKPRGQSISARFRPKFSQSITPSFVEEISAGISASEFLSFNKGFQFQKAYEIHPQLDKLLLYNVSLQSVIKKLKVVFGGSVISNISSGNKIVDIIIRDEKSNINEILANGTVKNKNGISIPLKPLLEFRQVSNLRTIKSDKMGEYFNISFFNNNIEKDKIEHAVLSSIGHLQNTEVSWTGSAYEQGILFKEFAIVLGISLLLLYLILAAQFESLTLPLIILIEVFFDISGALFFLYIFNASLNLMSALGIIVMSGIIINDSIIKIDTIRHTYKSGRPLLQAIFEGGHRRFYPIVMTSLTTILALVPLLFFGGLGIELQIPLALSIIGGLSLGTLVSLYFIPIMFYFIARKKFT
ncbi:MAG: efflux RND transporter permease subunit [Bacteroidales bacterium]|nr:efflux RND transporter permease subunit [Bacteroidales bacterium]